MANRLEQEKSPYLLQHKDNPVDWYPWGKEAFGKAAQEDKPVFLSIGYSTCHWCHVMAHESFENADVAAVLNREFVCIKVDREERPDIDAVYMSVCQALTGSGGWPLTILMTPEQKPFFAGTYFPRESRYGQMGLTDLLNQAAFLWRTQREKLLEAGEQITGVLRRGQPAKQDGVSITPDRSLLQGAYWLLEQSFDPVWGGFGAPPKFPIPHQILFLLRMFQLEGEPKALLMAETTLQAMARGGLFDQIGGGFSRYSTDEKWLVPHFEKMLYDNALLIIVYLAAYQLTGKARYGEIARRTADYILEELAAPAGGFFCGQDADSDGVEGKYYVFTPEEIIRVLGEKEGRDFCLRYHITEEGNFEGSSIPNRIETAGTNQNADDQREESQREEDRWEEARKRLYAYRRGRTKLHRDDKILLSWNGWAIIALARAGLILDDKRYEQAAIRAQQFIETNMTDDRNRLYLRFRAGEAAYDGQLEDYSVYALALLELYRITFDVQYLQQAVYRGQQMTALFEDREEGGFFMNAADAEQLITRPKEVYDGAIPSGNGVAAMVWELLAGLTGEVSWREAADRQHRFLCGQMAGYPAGHCFALLAMAKALYPHRELICAGSRVPDELTAYLREHGAENMSILFKSPENQEALAGAAPFTASYPIPEQGTVWYLCENGSCREPVTAFEQLELT